MAIINKVCNLPNMESYQLSVTFDSQITLTAQKVQQAKLEELDMLAS